MNQVAAFAIEHPLLALNRAHSTELLLLPCTRMGIVDVDIGVRSETESIDDGLDLRKA